MGAPRPGAGVAFQRPSNQPVVTEGVRQSSLAQAVGLIRDRRNLDGTIRDRPPTQGVRISDQQIEPHGSAIESIRTEIECIRRLVSHPNRAAPTASSATILSSG